jgi:hypothetical protein
MAYLLELKENSIKIAQVESLELLFLSMTEGNQDIPEIHLSEFCKFLDRQSQAFKQNETNRKSDDKRAKENGFVSAEEFRKHSSQGKKYNILVASAKNQDNKQHVPNVYAAEALFIHVNMPEIIHIYPELANAALLGTHSHQILSDLLYTTCRKMCRQIVGCITSFFRVIDIEQLTAEIITEPVDPSSE